MLRNKGLLFIVVASILFGGLFVGKQLFGRGEVKPARTEFSEKEKLVVYKSPSCGCCVGWISYMKKSDFDVEAVNTKDLQSIKGKYQIPYSLQSCHTAVIGDYFIEGHVPIEAINKLLEEKPDIDGIALPEMPAGSPGMPGIKSGEFVIYSLKDGIESEFMRL